ncbi:MAG TPA: hypothetical protein VFV94_08845 [Polyangiaceae bacterium]|nr:hypothetical protein [Polyangiaceae bacterium]
MTAHRGLFGTAAAGLVFSHAALASAETVASVDPSVSLAPTTTTPAPAPAADKAAALNAPPDAGLSRIQEVAKKGFTFFPSIQDPGRFRIAVGAYYDAIDPAVVYGMNVRVPQVSVDARLGLGDGWSLKAHLNSMYITTELLLGASYAGHFGNWSLEGTFTAGVYLGKLDSGGFDVVLLSPEYRPELALGYELGKVALTLRGSVMLMGPETVRVGDTWGGLDNSHAFVGHSEMLFVENTTQSNSVWYFGVGSMTTRAYYAMWLLFPDSPALFTYPRVVAGYEF